MASSIEQASYPRFNDIALLIGRILIGVAVL